MKEAPESEGAAQSGDRDAATPSGRRPDSAEGGLAAKAGRGAPTLPSGCSRSYLLIAGVVFLVSGLVLVPPTKHPFDALLGTLWVGAGMANLLMAVRGLRKPTPKPIGFALSVLNALALLAWLAFALFFLLMIPDI